MQSPRNVKKKERKNLHDQNYHLREKLKQKKAEKNKIKLRAVKAKPLPVSESRHRNTKHESVSD